MNYLPKDESRGGHRKVTQFPRRWLRQLKNKMGSMPSTTTTTTTTTTAAASTTSTTAIATEVEDKRLKSDSIIVATDSSNVNNDKKDMRSFPLKLASFALAAQTSSSLITPALAQDEPSPSLAQCLAAADIPYVDSNSDTWLEAIMPHNLRLPVTPAAVVYATSTEHVQDAVLCALQAGVKVSAKSGGHSYASFGLGGTDGHLVIQLDHMYGVTVREDNTAVISAGTRLGYAALQLYAQGKRAISHGTCPSVGVGGHVTHGGFGFSSHTHGLALDLMTGANVVLANGTLVHASATENSDLFWALRGAGSGFGIVTEFEFDTFPAPEEVTWFSVASNLAHGGKEAAVKSLLEFQSLLEGGQLDRNANMRLELGYGAAQTLEVVYHGTKEDAWKAVEPFIEPLALDFKSNKTKVTTGEWIPMLQSWTYGDPMNITYPYTGHDNGYTSSLVTKHISQEAMTSFVDFWFDVAKAEDHPAWWLQMDVHGDPSSRLSEVGSDDTAYIHRDKLWLFQFSSPMDDAPDTQTGIDFVHGFMDSLKGTMSESDWGRYACYVDSELTKEEAQEQYWGAHIDRLRGIKTKFDPADVFQNPQSISPVSKR